jgi:hypothetical protein
LRQVAGRLRSSCAVSSIARTMHFFTSRALAHAVAFTLNNASAASTVPAHVRKSLAVKSPPDASRM